MAIEGFDYQNFSQVLSSQAVDLVPADFTDFQKQYVVNTIQNFSNLAGEALYNDEGIKFDANQAMLITQIIAEWSFHKSVDLIKSGILPEHWDVVMQKIAFTIFEIAKQSLIQGLPQDQLLQLVEHHVQQAYKEALKELNSRGVIDERLMDKAEHQSNIDDMMTQIQQDKADYAQEHGGHSSSPSEDYKILKLASVALLLQQVAQDKVHAILNKFDPEDAKAVIQYMQMQDLIEKVDEGITMKCLQEIKTSLPEPKTVSPEKILSKMQAVFSSKDKEKIEILIRKERPNVHKFIASAQEGDFYNLPSKVANIIAQHLEESV